MTLSFAELAALAGKRQIADAACPMCGPSRKSPRNRVRPTLRIWAGENGFASFYCARCGASGYTRDRDAPRPDPVALARAREEAERFAAKTAEAKRKTARWLWQCRRPIAGSPAERYLRDVRGYGGSIPATLGYLRARGEHLHAMIAAYGMPSEPEPGVLAIADDAVRAIHLTRLGPDGRGKAEVDKPKITSASPSGWPIVVAPVNDLGGLAIAEGIEDALSVHEATGLGAWAAGSASLMPALADAVTLYVECVTVCVDDDKDGRKHASELVRCLRARKFEVIPRLLRSPEAAA